MSQLDRLRGALKDRGLDAFLVTDIPNLFWLTGFTGSFGQAIVTADSGRFISDSRYTLQAREQVDGLEVATFKNPVNVEDFLQQHLTELGVQRLAYDQNSVTVGRLLKWQDRWTGIDLQPVDDPIGELRIIKTAREVDLIRQACGLADECMQHLVSQIRPGVREIELLIELETFLRRRGSEASFAPIIVSGNRSARPHGVPSDKPLESGDFVTIDLGARIDGYCSDITRTVVVGAATDQQKSIYAAVLDAEQLGVSLLRPGANGREIDAAVRESLGRADLAQYFGHGLGHGLGALVHDTGRLSPTMDQAIAADQVWTVEPGVYIEGLGGVRIEDDVLVTADGPEVLTFFPRDLIEVGD